jgi:hypothetical protein
METPRKITVELPPDLLDQAQKATGAGIAQTVRTGLQLVAASPTPGQGPLLAHTGRAEGRPVIAADTTTPGCSIKRWRTRKSPRC